MTNKQRYVSEIEIDDKYSNLEFFDFKQEKSENILDVANKTSLSVIYLCASICEIFSKGRY